MKIVSIGYDYYELPNGIGSLEDFIKFIERQKGIFIKLKQFQTDECVFPYLVAEDVKDVYLNISKMDIISEEDATILTRVEYDCRLKKVVAEKCIHCSRYSEDCECDNLDGHRGTISLDGFCTLFDKVEE